MGFFLETTIVNEKQPIFSFVEKVTDNGIVKHKTVVGETVSIELQFVSYGDTNDFSVEDIAKIIMSKLGESLEKNPTD